MSADEVAETLGVDLVIANLDKDRLVEIVVDTLDDVSIATDDESIAVTTVETTEETSTELDDPAGIDDAIEYVDSAASVQSEVSATIPVAAPEDLDLNLDFGFEQLPAVQVDSIETQNVGTTDEEIERFLATLRRLMEGRRG